MTAQHTHPRRGTVTELPDGRRRLEFRRSWPDPVEDVWSALTEPERTVRWIGTYDGQRVVGGVGTFTMTQELEPASEEVRIVECEPPRRLVVEWVGQGDWRVELDLVREDGRTVLTFRQDFAAGADVADVAGGWHWYLDKLDAEVTGGDGPGEWEPFWAAVGPLYGRGPA
ncbi:SRPBCC domain-containing protein [Geodermatophilus marinus]|uniref:SRPBCC domain-containing protein n=1 Tax=Geodermatophilus sp. LHW52908 TaxID=2303986 RepID=UPI000E3E611C|nr:SRPBCC domain-containing protein [Geodermatophilus sp. LHW52908]RFU23100.1 ATPase [Geodermatophilus sp. LHW52908]